MGVFGAVYIALFKRESMMDPSAIDFLSSALMGKGLVAAMRELFGESWRPKFLTSVGPSLPLTLPIHLQFLICLSFALSQ